MSISTAKCVLPRPPSSTSQGAPDQSLLSILGVLRRPATATDALPAWAYLSFNEEVFVRYIRRARVVGGFAYYVIPAIVTRCEPEKAYQSVTLRRTNGRLFSATGGATALDIKRHGDFFGSGRRAGGSTLQGLVPDGVASVTLHYPADPAAALPAVTTTAKVAGNVVVFTSITRGRGHALGAKTVMVWRAANGTIIKTFSGL